MWVRSTGGTAVDGTVTAVGGVGIADVIVAVRPVSVGSPDCRGAVPVLVLSSATGAGVKSAAGVSVGV